MNITKLFFKFTLSISIYKVKNKMKNKKIPHCQNKSNI